MKRFYLDKFKEIIRNPKKITMYTLCMMAPILPDRLYLKAFFRLKMGYKLNLDNPQTFGEKLQWLKIYNRKPEYSKMVDKVGAKEYVANLIGEEYIIPTIGVWNRVEDIDFDKLPNQFVLKCTHDSGGIVICNDKSNLDVNEAKNKLKRGLKKNFYARNREWPYKNVVPRIIAEKFIELENCKDLPDYKFYCFNGEPKYCQVIRDRSNVQTIDFYDMKWHHMPFVGLNPIAKNGLTPVEKPKRFDEIIDICRKLSSDIPFVRVDLYITNVDIFFGEITFFPASGMGAFEPMEWNYTLGSYIELDK